MIDLLTSMLSILFALYLIYIYFFELSSYHLQERRMPKNVSRSRSSSRGTLGSQNSIDLDGEKRFNYGFITQKANII